MIRKTIRRPTTFQRLEPRNLLAGDGLFQAVHEFSLPDVNPTSATYGQDVSPSDYVGKVSAWYFGHAT